MMELAEGYVLKSESRLGRSWESEEIGERFAVLECEAGEVMKVESRCFNTWGGGTRSQAVLCWPGGLFPTEYRRIVPCPSPKILEGDFHWRLTPRGTITVDWIVPIREVSGNYVVEYVLRGGEAKRVILVRANTIRSSDMLEAFGKFSEVVKRASAVESLQSVRIARMRANGLLDKARTLHRLMSLLPGGLCSVPEKD
jgi:hypothetical protein